MSQLLLFDLPEQENESFYMRLSSGSIDNFFCVVGKVFCGIISMIGLLVILAGAVEEARREEKIEELVYKRNEDDDFLDEVTKDWTLFEKHKISPFRRKMIVRERIKRRMQTDPVWANKILSQ